MEHLAKAIVAIIRDYHNHVGFQFTEAHVIDWITQFDEEDRQFILEEFLYLLEQGIYISRDKAKQLLSARIEELTTNLRYPDPVSLLSETVFLDLQKPGKSQQDLLALLNEIIMAKYGISLNNCGTKAHKIFIYLDDVLATGNTIAIHLSNWLQSVNEDGKFYYDLVNRKKITLIVSVFCYHNWGWANTQWKFKQQLGDDQIMNNVLLYHDYEIQNHIRRNNPRLNLAYPIEPQPEAINAYLRNLEATTNLEVAYRKVNLPSRETFFSSPTNRTRFENILLHKGVDIINRVRNINARGLRPLGYTAGTHKTHGLGTLFFLWRNIPNNCPLVFWWDNPAHNWKGLFPVQNRGI